MGYIHDVAVKGGSGSHAIYLDDCDSGDTFVGNIVYRSGNRGVLLGGGRDNTFRGNIFIDHPIGIHVDGRGPRGIVFDRPDSLNLLASARSLATSRRSRKTRYPRLATIHRRQSAFAAGQLDAPEHPHRLQKAFRSARRKSIRKWLDRANKVEWIVNGVSRFVRPLTAGPTASRETARRRQKVAGFEPIPVERFGSRTDS